MLIAVIMAAVIPKTMDTRVPESMPSVSTELVWVPDEKEKGVNVAKR